MLALRTCTVDIVRKQYKYVFAPSTRAHFVSAGLQMHISALRIDPGAEEMENTEECTRSQSVPHIPPFSRVFGKRWRRCGSTRNSPKVPECTAMKIICLCLRATSAMYALVCVCVCGCVQMCLCVFTFNLNSRYIWGKIYTNCPTNAARRNGTRLFVHG